MREGTRCAGDKELAEILQADPLVQRAAEQRARDRFDDTRRHLLSTAVRLTPSMAPSVHRVAEECREALSMNEGLEVYVSPSPHHNAFSYGAAGDRVFVGFTSALLEQFSEDELRFVMGHELGHYLFRHHDIPVYALVKGAEPLRPAQALRLFSWQRFAEISADRAGLICAGHLDPVARAFFRLASGLTGNAIAFDLEAFLSQVGDIAAEVSRSRTDATPRADWFASHPFSPLRVRAAELAQNSELCTKGGPSIADLEAKVGELMALMEPNYLVDKSASGEAMRRVLFAGGVLVAAADGEVQESERQRLEAFLGEGAVGEAVDPEALRADLPNRVAFAREEVPVLKRAQIVRDLCVISLADGHSGPNELAVLRDLARDLEVDVHVVDQTLAVLSRGLD